MTAGSALSSPACSLADPKVGSVLERLHAEANAQKRELGWMLLKQLPRRLASPGRESTPEEEAASLRNFYICISPKQGSLFYMIARSISARRVVEFGTSFGVSAIYFAAAVRDNGGGLVIGSELEPGKVRQARRNLEEAGLAELVEIREGDARETLRDPGGDLDMVLLDGAKQLYLPILELLKPRLRPGAVVVGDNIHTFHKALRPYVRHVQDPKNGFRSVTLFLADGTEYSVRL